MSFPSNPFYVDPDIFKAHTLPSEVYTNSEIQIVLKEKLFQHSWQWLDYQEGEVQEENLIPFEFIPGFFEEPMLLIKDNNELTCLSNVCTHRGKVLVEKPQKKSLISCGYHGRCFRLDGQFKSMPEFKGVENFPSQEDHLPAYFVKNWRGFLMSALRPTYDLDVILEPIEKCLGHFPFQELVYHSQLSKSYHINAHWLTYCDNYLEGFHIPFVHPTLNEAVRFEDYEVRTYPFGNVQIARCKPDQPSINLPVGHPDFGKEIYAYYWFIYPNLMLNFYHWGVSVNWVLPRTTTQTEVRFRTYIHKNISVQAFQNTYLDLTELEDEVVVESVQRGLSSRAYRRGRFSPSREQGVHAFHEYLYREVFQQL